MTTRQLATARSPAPRLRVAITGGTSGLGLALVRAFEGRGDAVAFCARNPDRVATIARLLPRTHGIVADVSNKEAIHPLAMRVNAALGGVDVLVNNASSLGPVPLAPLGDTGCEALESALSTNLLGPFRLTRALLGALASSARERRGAVVVNVSSDAAVNAYPGWGAYGASKAALRYLTSIWHQELSGEGIAFLSIDPGDMDTPLHARAVPDADRARLRRPEDAAQDIVTAIANALPKRDRLDTAIASTR